MQVAPLRGEGVPSWTLPPCTSRGFPEGLGLGFWVSGDTGAQVRRTLGRSWTPRDSRLLQVCGVPTPPPPWPVLSWACGGESPCPLTWRRALNLPPKFPENLEPPAVLLTLAARRVGKHPACRPAGFCHRQRDKFQALLGSSRLEEKQKLTASQTFLPLDLNRN